jgi:deoxyribose-phosphate aldolase
MILETALLTDSEKLRLCDVAMESGVTFVKTSTGFSGGTTPKEVRCLKGHVGELCGVKATGGIRTLSDVLAMVEAGASRIGTSKGFEIAESLEEL